MSERLPAVAGMFYPGDPAVLGAEVRDLLDHSASQPDGRPKALIAPHAGYPYSGPIAASAYKQLQPYRDSITRVVLLGPSHRVYLDGMAFPSVARFVTPLGSIALDQDGIERALALPQTRVLDAAHDQEHALEVQLPFLQTVLGEFSIVPVLVGEARPQAVAQVLDMLWGGPETLIVISSDLSHYLDYDAARAMDSRTCRRIEHLDADIGHEDACGATPLRGMLLAAKHRGMDVSTLDLRNSGDTEGDRDFVVGYGAWMFV